MRYATTKTWAEYFEREEGVSIGASTILRRFRDAEVIGKDGRNKFGRLLKRHFYSELDVRSACHDLLIPNLPQSDKSGFFEKEGVKYGTARAWGRVLRISGEAISSRLKKFKVISILGKNINGRKADYYPEPDVLLACADLLEEMPQANEEGFFEKEDVTYGTIGAWDRVLPISTTAIQPRLKSNKINSIPGKDSTGRKTVFYSEPDVLSACADLLEGRSKANEEGFYEKGGVRFGAIGAWGRVLPISYRAIQSRLKKFKATSIPGRNSTGRKIVFYSEPDVLLACADLLEEMPQANEEGFFEKEDVTYGTIEAWKRALPISADLIRSRLKAKKVTFIPGKDSGGRKTIFYSEPDVLLTCTDLLSPLSYADKTGFFEKNGETWGSIKDWFVKFQISRNTIKKRLQKSNAPFIEMRISSGNKIRFYSESTIHTACADLLKELPQADDSGFFEKDGETWGTQAAWGRKLPISHGTIRNLIKESNAPCIEGKDSGGRITDFYCESTVRRVCANLLKELPQTDESGLFEKDGELWGSIGAWGKKLPISTPTLKDRLQKPEIFSIEGKDSIGRILNFYCESTVRRVCADILKELPQADDSGFFEKNGETWGSVNAWSKKLPITHNTIQSRLQKTDSVSIEGRSSNYTKTRFHSESSVLVACADLIAKRSKTSQKALSRSRNPHAA